MADNLATTLQPCPALNKSKYIKDMVKEDLDLRAEVGREKYGTFLQAHNGRSALIDLYQELLDAVCYLRQLIEEEGDK